MADNCLSTPPETLIEASQSSTSLGMVRLAVKADQSDALDRNGPSCFVDLWCCSDLGWLKQFANPVGSCRASHSRFGARPILASSGVAPLWLEDYPSFQYIHGTCRRQRGSVTRADDLDADDEILESDLWCIRCRRNSGGFCRESALCQEKQPGESSSNEDPGGRAKLSSLGTHSSSRGGCIDSGKRQ
jgi:hypothetical protein